MNKSTATPRDNSRTVELTERDIEDATRLLALLVTKGRNRRSKQLAKLASRTEQRLQQVQAILADRRRRTQLFSAAMFGEPAWEMLLNLYLIQSTGVRLNVSRVAEGSGSPQSTALRWLDYLENQRLVKREAHPTDSRASFVELTERAHQLLEVYFSETLTDRR